MVFIQMPFQCKSMISLHSKRLNNTDPLKLGPRQQAPIKRRSPSASMEKLLTMAMGSAGEEQHQQREEEPQKPL